MDEKQQMPQTDVIADDATVEEIIKELLDMPESILKKIFDALEKKMWWQKKPEAENKPEEKKETPFGGSSFGAF